MGLTWHCIPILWGQWALIRQSSDARWQMMCVGPVTLWLSAPGHTAAWHRHSYSCLYTPRVWSLLMLYSTHRRRSPWPPRTLWMWPKAMLILPRHLTTCHLQAADCVQEQSKTLAATWASVVPIYGASDHTAAGTYPAHFHTILTKYHSHLETPIWVFIFAHQSTTANTTN